MNSNKSIHTTQKSRSQKTLLYYLNQKDETNKMRITFCIVPVVAVADTLFLAEVVHTFPAAEQVVHTERLLAVVVVFVHTEPVVVLHTEHLLAVGVHHIV